MSTDPLIPNIGAEASMAMAKSRDTDAMKKMAEGGAQNLEEVASKFEGVFLGFLIKQMWESVEKSDLLPETGGREIQEGMLTTMLADYISENGGIGIADSMVRQMKKAAEAYESQKELLTRDKADKNGANPDAESGNSGAAPLVEK